MAAIKSSSNTPKEFFIFLSTIFAGYIFVISKNLNNKKINEIVIAVFIK